ncbi:hypothetical protein ACB098_02G056900 [Castanea mollissima]
MGIKLKIKKIINKLLSIILITCRSIAFSLMRNKTSIITRNFKKLINKLLSIILITRRSIALRRRVHTHTIIVIRGWSVIPRILIIILRIIWLNGRYFFFGIIMMNGFRALLRHNWVLV